MLAKKIFTTFSMFVRNYTWKGMNMQIADVSNTNFGIKFHPSLKRQAAKFFIDNNGSKEQFDRFYRKMCYMKHNYGYDKFTITPRTIKEGGSERTALYAIPDAGVRRKKVLLTVKDNFRQVFERIIHMDEKFLELKIGRQFAK